MKQSQKHETLVRAPATDPEKQKEPGPDLRRRDWLVLIVLYPMTAPAAGGTPPSGFKRLLEVLSVLLKVAGMAFALYQAVQGGGS